MTPKKILLNKLITILCIVLFAFQPTAVFGEAPADTAAADPAATGTPTPEPTPTIPPSFYEPIQTNETKDWPEGPAVYAESAIVMDADTGSILYAKNVDAKKYPASITKIMTTLLAIENSHPNDRVIFSEHAIWGIERDSSHIGIKVGENLSMKDCLYGMMLESANEVCLAVAEHISGDVDSFVALMNQRAKELGCEHTHFTNPNGLPDENHYTTAKDMALIAQAAFKNGAFREVCGTKVYRIGWTNKTWEDRWLNNHHKMLQDGEYHYEGCLGGKTGYTEAALNTLVTFANRNDMNLICVTMRTEGRQVYLDTASLLDYGFTNFHRISISDGKLAAYPGYFLPFPAFFLECDSEKTRADLLKNTYATVPADCNYDNLALDTNVDENAIHRTFTYNNYTVGTDNITQPPGLKTLLTKQTATNGSALKEKVSDYAANVGHTFAELPTWKYPALIILGLAVIMLLVRIVFFFRRRRRRRKKKKKTNM